MTFLGAFLATLLAAFSQAWGLMRESVESARRCRCSATFGSGTRHHESCKWHIRKPVDVYQHDKLFLFVSEAIEHDREIIDNHCDIIICRVINTLFAASQHFCVMHLESHLM